VEEDLAAFALLHVATAIQWAPHNFPLHRPYGRAVVQARHFHVLEEVHPCLAECCFSRRSVYAGCLDLVEKARQFHLGGIGFSKCRE
jgi:hypothetical protein